MKKLKLEELNLGNAEVLSREELKKVLGGGSGAGSGGSCTVRCDQSSSDGTSVSDCSRTTVSKVCSDLSNAVCVCS